MDQPNTIPMAGVAAPAPISRSEEQSITALAHFSMLLNLVTGFLGVAGALVLYVVYRDRSRYVSMQTLQALIFQLGGLVVPGVLVGATWAVTGVLILFFGLGLLLVPFAILVSVLVALVVPIMAIYSIYGGVQCLSGREFRYWLAGDLAEKILMGGKRDAATQTMEGASSS
jgi:uncharacterized protein